MTNNLWHSKVFNIGFKKKRHYEINDMIDMMIWMNSVNYINEPTICEMTENNSLLLNVISSFIFTITHFLFQNALSKVCFNVFYIVIFPISANFYFIFSVLKMRHIQAYAAMQFLRLQQIVIFNICFSFNYWTLLNCFCPPNSLKPTALTFKI